MDRVYKVKGTQTKWPRQQLTDEWHARVGVHLDGHFEDDFWGKVVGCGESSRRSFRLTSNDGSSRMTGFKIHQINFALDYLK